MSQPLGSFGINVWCWPFWELQTSPELAISFRTRGDQNEKENDIKQNADLKMSQNGANSC